MKSNDIGIKNMNEKMKKFSKISKDGWYQFQENFKFEGRKIIFFKGWSRTKGVTFQRRCQISKKNK